MDPVVLKEDSLIMHSALEEEAVLFLGLGRALSAKCPGSDDLGLANVLSRKHHVSFGPRELSNLGATLDIGTPSCLDSYLHNLLLPYSTYPVLPPIGLKDHTVDTLNKLYIMILLPGLHVFHAPNAEKLVSKKLQLLWTS
jgi:hypothetical protein